MTSFNIVTVENAPSETNKPNETLKNQLGTFEKGDDYSSLHLKKRT